MMGSADLAAVAAALGEAAKTSGVLGEATSYHLASGGKAWRAHLALACGEALGLHRDAAVGLAVASELVHQSSVLHDDVHDETKLRRGRPSVPAQFGPQIALCAGNHLLVTAFAQLAPLPQAPALARLFGAGISQMAAAQAEEFNPTLWPAMTWPRYERLIAGKSGAMVILPIAGAALLARLPDADIAPLSRAARICGMAYQACDDVQDVDADLASGSLNGVIVRGLETAGPAERAAWIALLAQARRQPLSAAETAPAATRLRDGTEFVREWVAALLPRAMTALRSHTSRRCAGLNSVIDEIARSLMGNEPQIARFGTAPHVCAKSQSLPTH